MRTQNESLLTSGALTRAHTFIWIALATRKS
jgi:hypothetical protein